MFIIFFKLNTNKTTLYINEFLGKFKYLSELKYIRVKMNTEKQSKSVYKIFQTTEGHRIHEIRQTAENEFQVHFSGYTTPNKEDRDKAQIMLELKEIGFYNRFHDSNDDLRITKLYACCEDTWMHNVAIVKFWDMYGMKKYPF